MLRHHRLTTLLVSLFALVVHCTVHADDSVEIERDITYGQGGETNLKLDLARPADGSGPFPAIVFIHGGGWTAGGRSSFGEEMLAAAERGYVAITIDYRLTDPDENMQPRNPFPAQIHDVKCAVRWLRKNADQYGVDPERIGAMGDSAGGHLSCLLALSGGVNEFEGTGGHGDTSSAVQAAVNYFGPTDLAQLHADSPDAAKYIDLLMAGGPDGNSDSYKLASPVSHIDRDDPPILTVHGTEDKLVPPNQAEILDAQMKSAGASHTLLLLEGQKHGFRDAGAEQALNASFDFFDQCLKP